MNRLVNKTAIITGGADGIGFGISKAFAKEGASVVLVDVDDEKGKKAVAELAEYGSSNLFIHADLTDHESLSTILAQTVEKFGRVDVLVNNAHASRLASFLETTKKI